MFKKDLYTVDKVFKIGLLVLGCIFLFLYSFHVGRYEYRYNSGAFQAFDTSKGILYVVGKETVVADIIAIAKNDSKE